MNRKGFAVMAVLVGLVLSVGAIAQAGGGWGGRGGKGRMYDPTTVATVTGTVESVAKVQMGRGQGVHVTVKTAEGSLEVDLGPSFYVDAQPVKLAAGDAVTVTGSKIMRGGRAVIIAAEITKGGQVLKLRDPATGVPLWSRGGGWSK